MSSKCKFKVVFIGVESMWRDYPTRIFGVSIRLNVEEAPSLSIYMSMGILKSSGMSFPVDTGSRQTRAPSSTSLSLIAWVKRDKELIKLQWSYWCAVCYVAEPDKEFDFHWYFIHGNILQCSNNGINYVLCY